MDSTQRMHLGPSERAPAPYRSGVLRWSAALVVALALPACKAEREPLPNVPSAPSPAVPVDECSVDADCGFGEIDHEIQDSDDCPCLYGCPYLPLSRETIERRQSQYDGVCEPGVDGTGESCGIDDCARPPTPACVAGSCSAARDPNG